MTRETEISTNIPASLGPFDHLPGNPQLDFADAFYHVAGEVERRRGQDLLCRVEKRLRRALRRKFGERADAECYIPLAFVEEFIDRVCR